MNIWDFFCDYHHCQFPPKQYKMAAERLDLKFNPKHNMEIPKIKRLDESVINKIAAGEVIQRPANALKELIENSLDAKSTNIQITVKNGGLQLLEIQDNGIGINKSDLDIVCERYTTSKLREFEDLKSIATYGFRGEALASISHVAHLTIITKTADEPFAYKVSYVDGKMQGAPKPSAGTQGTQIIVEDLFYNMSVRKRALRSSAEEYQKVADVVGKYAVHNASVGFSLKKSGENVDIRTAVNSTHVDNIRTIYGYVIARELMEFKLESESFKFKANGYISNVNYSSKKLNFLLFINHRLVDCQSLKKCIQHIYANYLPKNTHPFVYLSLEIHPKNIDVNIHPTKHEVHFLNEDRIIELISNAMEAKLLCSNQTRKFNREKEKLTEIQLEETKDKSKDDLPQQKFNKYFSNSFIEKCTSAEAAEIFEDQLTNGCEANTLALPTTLPDIHPLTISTTQSNQPRIETNLTSILELRKDIEDHCHKALRDIFARHIFLGCIDPGRAVIQHDTKLYMCTTRKITWTLFYQLVIYNFQNFDKMAFTEPLSIEELALTALDLPETQWTPEDGDKRMLAERVKEILVEKRDMLEEYFSMEVDEDGMLASLPLLLANHTPEISSLPMYILRLATEVEWEDEKQCFKSFARETGLYYSEIKGNTDWTWTVENVFFPAIKEYFLPPRRFTKNGAVLEIANLTDMYKVFERC